MSRFSHSIQWCVAVPIICGLLLLGVVTVTSSPPSDVTIQEPVAVAAPPGSQPTGNVGVSVQPFVVIAKEARASVVNISSVKKRLHRSDQGLRPFFDDPFFRRFFGEEFGGRIPAPREHREQGLGSGVIVTSDGYIITNNHVVEGADELTVSLPDKRTFKAKVVGTDPKTDVAVVRIAASNLPVLPWGDATQLQVGEMVLAVGNPFGLSQTVTMGIISAVGRANMGIVDYEDFIQTDAAINPGNSGGALVNLKGELIGINTAIFTQSGGYMGIGFAIPSNMAKSVMTSLIQHGKVVRGWLGVSIQELTPELAQQFGTTQTNGALVGDVMEEGPAAKAKLERGDIIIAYHGTTVRDPGHLRALVAETAPGTTVTVSLVRNGETRTVSVTIGELPKDVASASGSDRSGTTGHHALAGITVENFSPQDERFGRSTVRSGVVVTKIDADSPAAQAGLRTGDIIREINRKAVKDVRDFQRLTGELKPNRPVLVLLNRGNATIYLSIRGDR